MNSRKNRSRSRPKSLRLSNRSHQRKRSLWRSNIRAGARREELRMVVMGRRNEAGVKIETEATRGARKMPKVASGFRNQSRKRQQKISLMPNRRRKSLLSKLRPNLKPRNRCSHSKKISKRKLRKVLLKASRRRNLRNRRKRKRRQRKPSHKRIRRPTTVRPRCRS